LLKRLTVNLEVVGGKPTIRGRWLAGGYVSGEQQAPVRI
jgi:uncharacterized protein (DUF433 family)